MGQIYKLSPNERRILGQIEFWPERTADEVAKRLRMKSTTVAAVMRKLVDRGIIWRRAFVDPMRLGYQDIGLFFNISGATPAVRKRIIERFVSCPDIGWFGILAGQFQYGSIYLCRHIAELGEFLRAVAVDSGVYFNDRVITPRVSYTRFTRRYLYPQENKPHQLSFSHSSPHATVDDVDVKILGALDARHNLSVRQIALQLDIPHTTVDRRIKRLVNEQVIRGFMYEIDIEKLGVGMSRLLVQTQGPYEVSRQSIQEFCRDCSFVTYLVEAMGTWDVEIGFESFSPQDDVEILQNFYDRCGAYVSSSRVMREMKDLKFSYSPWRT